MYGTRDKHRDIILVVFLLLGGIAPLTTYGTCPPCPGCSPCWELQEGACMDAGLISCITGDPYYYIERCKEKNNPPNVSTAEQWANFFQICSWTWDLDGVKNHWWNGCEGVPGNECRKEENEWHDHGDGFIWLAYWTFDGAAVDLTKVGEYKLKAHFLDTPPLIRCNPCSCEDGTENCPACQKCEAKVLMAWPDPPVEKTFTVKVVDCCACNECDQTISDWLPLWTSEGCGPGNNWSEDLVTDYCGNTLTVACSGGVYTTSYGGANVGTCIWRCAGRNYWCYQKADTKCGWKIYATFHRTIDHDVFTPGCDRGYCHVYDWLDTFYYPCSGAQPTTRCCAGSDYPEYDTDNCPDEGVCVDSNACQER